MLHALASSDDEAGSESLHELFDVLVANGDRNEFSAHAVPGLVGLAVDPAQALRVHILRLLLCIAVGEGPLPLGVRIVELRAGVAAAPDPADAIGRLEAWRRLPRPRGRRPISDAEMADLLAVWGLAGYDAVRRELSALRPLVQDPDVAVASAAAWTLGWFPEDADANSAALVKMISRSADPYLTANGLIALALLGKVDAGIDALLVDALADEERLVRFGAALASARRFGVALPPAAVETLREHALLTDTSWNETWGIDPAQYALKSLDLAAPDIADAVRDELVAISLANADDSSRGIALSVLSIAWPTGTPGGATYRDLTPAQQRVVRWLLEQPSTWIDDALTRGRLHRLGLPDRQAALTAYAATEF